MSRPNEEICVSLIHEMGHAVVHPIGADHDIGAYQRHPRPEERIVNGAAEVVCRRYGIPGCIARMASVGAAGCVTNDELDATERVVAEHVASELVRLLAGRE